MAFWALSEGLGFALHTFGVSLWGREDLLGHPMYLPTLAQKATLGVQVGAVKLATLLQKRQAIGSMVELSTYIYMFIYTYIHIHKVSDTIAEVRL